MASKQDMKRLREALVKQGFVVEHARNGHYRVTSPNGAKMQMAATPSDHRGLLNTVARLRRIGFDRNAA